MLGLLTLSSLIIFSSVYVLTERSHRVHSCLPNIKGVAIGVSKEKHAKTTFELLKKGLR